MKTTSAWPKVLLVIFAALSFLLANRPALAERDLAPAQDPLHPTEVFSIGAPADSLEEAFALAGRPHYLEDRVSFFPNPSLGLGTVITVQRALPVRLLDGKQVLTVRTWASDVAGLLSEKKISLGADDLITPALGTKLAQEMTISITRVDRTTVAELETVPFKTLEQEDAGLWRGERQVVQEGQNGRLQKDYLVIRQNGDLISKTLIGTTVLEQVRNRIIKIGTKLKIGLTLFGKATWYDCCGTRVATDAFPRGTELRVTNMANGRSIIIRNDGCICGAQGVLIDLHPSLFTQLGGALGQGVLSSVRVEQILN